MKSYEYKGWKTAEIDATFEVGSGAEGLQEALARICEEASQAIQVSARRQKESVPGLGRPWYGSLNRVPLLFSHPLFW